MDVDARAQGARAAQRAAGVLAAVNDDGVDAAFGQGLLYIAIPFSAYKFEHLRDIKLGLQFELHKQPRYTVL